MYIFVTAGRGTENFVENEITEKLLAKSVMKIDGKIFFETDLLPCDLMSSVIHLKSVERIFMCVLHKNDLSLSPVWKAMAHLETTLKTVQSTQWMNFYRIYQQCSMEYCKAVSKITDGTSSDGNLLQSLSTINQIVEGHVKGHTETGNSDSGNVSSASLETCHDITSSQPKIHDSSLLLSDTKDKSKRRKLDSDTMITFRVSCKVTGRPYRLFKSQELGKSLGVILKHHINWKPDLRHPMVEIFIHLNDAGLTIGIPLVRTPLSERTYLKHIGLRTPVAYIMGCLAHIKAGDIILDATCGTGTILTEAVKSWPFAHCVGFDLDMNQLKKAAENVILSKETSRIQLICCDARFLPLATSSVDAIISDLPFGNIHGSERDMHVLYPKLIKSFHRVLKKGGHCVLLTSERLKDFLLHVLSGDRTMDGSYDPDNNMSAIQNPGKYQDMKPETKHSVVNQTHIVDECDLESLRKQSDASWITSSTHYIKLGDTHAFICSFIKQ